MKKSILILSGIILANYVLSQQQIGNSNFESWESSSPELHEPTNWNSFKTASGTWSSFAGQQMDWSTSVRPGSTGTKSIWIWSNEVTGVIANGNLTLGQINMGSTTPANAANYNYTKTADPAFNEPLTDTPDSIIFWVKYTPITASSQARVSTVLHDNYNFKDPNEVNDGIHCVATAILNFGTTNGLWVRKSIPFTYTGIVATNTHILATFTTNMTPGGGNDNDQVWIDDVELIYNPANLFEESNESSVNPITVFVSDQKIQINAKEEITGNYSIYSSSGAVVQRGKIETSITFINTTGIYFIHLDTDQGLFVQKIANL